MLVQIPHLIWRHEAIGHAAEDPATLGSHLRLEDEGRHDAEDLEQGLGRDASLAQLARLRIVGVLEEQPLEASGGNPGNRAVEPRLHRRQQRRVVAAERQAEHADGRRLLGTDPRQQPTDIPHGLGLGVHRVEGVGAHEAVAAASPELAVTVQGKHGQQHVQSELAVVDARVEGTQVDKRRAHLIAVDADEPGARWAGVTQHPGVGGAVLGVAQPAFATRLLGVGLVLAVEAQVLEVDAARPRLADTRGVEGKRLAVIAFGLFEPSE